MANSKNKIIKSIKEEADQPTKCVCCGRIYNKQRTNFRPTKSILFAANKGYLPVCSICLDKDLKQWSETLKDEEQALRRVCLHWNIYFNTDLAKSIIEKRGTDGYIGSYFSQLNMAQWGNGAKTYDNTIEEDLIAKDEEEVEVEEEPPEVVPDIPATEEPKPKTIKVTQKAKKIWGDGFEPEEYLILEDEYDSWLSRIKNKENITKGLENTIREICRIGIDIRRSRACGVKPTDLARLQEVQLKLMESAGLKPIQEDNTNIAEKNAFGVLIDNWESTDPVPKYPEEHYLIRYIRTWFKGHLAKAANLQNDTKEEYESDIEKYKIKLFDEQPDDTANNTGGDDNG